MLLHIADSVFDFILFSVFHSGDDKLSSVSEEIWRERSGSGSSYNENDCPPASERRLSWANKSYSVGDLAEKLSSPK